MSLAFWITTLIVVASPGTGVAFTLAAGLSRGARASLVAAFGCTLGIAPHVAAAMLGLAAVLHASAVAFAAVKYAGVAYLLFMAWNALREGGSLSVDNAPTRRSDLRVVVDAIAVNLLNPKLSIFFVAFLPQFVGAGEAHPLIRMGELSAAFMLGDLRRLRALRRVRRRGAPPCPRTPARARLAAPQLRRRLRRAGGQAGVRGTVRAARQAGNSAGVSQLWRRYDGIGPAEFGKSYPAAVKPGL